MRETAAIKEKCPASNFRNGPLPVIFSPRSLLSKGVGLKVILIFWISTVTHQKFMNARKRKSFDTTQPNFLHCLSYFHF